MSKVGRNDPCPCGSGKKYKNCHMKIDQEKATAAKYTAAGKRKFKAKVLSSQDKSLSVFSRSAQAPEIPQDSDALQRLKFRLAKKNYQQKSEEEKAKEEALPFEIPTSETAEEAPKPSSKPTHRPGEDFKPTSDDFQT